MSAMRKGARYSGTETRQRDVLDAFGQGWIRKGDGEIAIIPQGKSFGGLSFLLLSQRAATVVALEDVELVMLNNENISKLMNEFPELVVEMLREMALRLRETNKVID